MSIALLPLAGGAVAQVKGDELKKVPTKRQLTAVADEKTIPEPR